MKKVKLGDIVSFKDKEYQVIEIRDNYLILENDSTRIAVDKKRIKK